MILRMLTHDATEAQDDEEDEPTRVIFSLTVHSDHPIAALAGLTGRKRQQKKTDDYFYEVLLASFEDRDWSSRADKLDEVVTSAIDRLEATRVDLDELAQDDVSVRAFFTFDPGAETIRAELVSRLARIHAAIWIDA
jgi:hypothetical protein